MMMMDSLDPRFEPTRRENKSKKKQKARSAPVPMLGENVLPVVERNLSVPAPWSARPFCNGHEESAARDCT